MFPQVIQPQQYVGLYRGNASAGNTDKHAVYCMPYRRPHRTAPTRRHSRRCCYALQQFPRLKLSRTATGPSPVLKSLAPRLIAKISWIKVTSAGEPVVWGLKCRRRSSIRVTPVCPLCGRNWLRPSDANSWNDTQEAANRRARDQVFNPGSDAAVPAAVRHCTWR